MQHNRELEEQARHHDVALKDAQALYAQRYETFEKSVESSLARQREELEAKHNAVLEEEQTRHREILFDEIQELSKQLASANDQEAVLYKQIEEMNSGRDATEQRHIDELDSVRHEASQKDAEFEKQLEAALEARDEKHSATVQSLVSEISQLKSGQDGVLNAAREEVAESHRAEKKLLEDAIAQQASEQEDILQQALQELVSKHKEEKFGLEQTLAQLKESQEKQLHDAMREASERHAAERQSLEQALAQRETEHAEALKAALDKQRLELAERHRSSITQRAPTSNEDAAGASGTRNASSSISSQAPLSPSATFRRPKRLSVSRGSSSSGLTLEGTLESIRIQTEQLLELNDDFISERKRWSSRLSGARSSSGTTSAAEHAPQMNGVAGPDGVNGVPATAS